MLLFISGAEIVFVFFIVLLVVGADKIPSIARTLAKGMTQVRQDGNKCVRKWNCKFRSGENAGRSSGWFVTHARAEFNTPNHTGGFIREDQWQNFRKPNSPERPGITNIRETGAKMAIATYLGASC